MASIASGAFPLPLAETPMLALLLQNRVCVGFPSPAEVLGAQRVDMTQVLLVHALAKATSVQARGLLGGGW